MILMLPLSQDICRFHGSPFLCSNLPTPCQLLCLGDGNSPSLASDSHFSPALPCSCKVHLFLFIALPKESPMIHMPCASCPCSPHPLHRLFHHHCSPIAPAVSQPQGLCTCFPPTIPASPPHGRLLLVSHGVLPDCPCLKYMFASHSRHPISLHIIPAAR